MALGRDFTDEDGAPQPAPPPGAPAAAQQGPPPLPAIAVTAYASLRDRELAIQAGYSWHVAKPIDPAQLLIALTAAITTRAGAERRPTLKKAAAPRRATKSSPRS